LASIDSLRSRGGDLLIRPVRPGDRDRVVELVRDVWDGHDYIQRVFDDWVSEAGATFQAVELDGVVVGLQRLRPYAPGLIWYEGLRVASTHRRQGLARTMLTSAISEAREQGFREMRLATGNPTAVRLFESAGFKRLIDVRWWKGVRVEGGESARIPGPDQAEKMWAAILGTPGIDLYGGVTADFNGAHDLGVEEIARLAETGMLRAGPGGRALAGLRVPWSDNVAVAFLAGRGGALRELLLALRFEADADGLADVTIALPRDHPAHEDLRASGYDLVNDEDTSYIYGLIL
jgi:GNAT superfamily N-acetyltransferase